MKRLINITAKAATAILAVALTASCVFEKDDAVRGNDRGMNNVLVQIGVSADGMTQTKADVIAGTDQAGEGVETAISTLRLYAYIGNVLSGYAYVPKYSATDKIYMDLKNLPSSGTQQVEFVAVANEGSMTGIDGIDIEVGTNPDGTISLPSNFGRNSFGGLKYTIANQEFTAIVDEKEQVVGMPMYATKTVTIDVDRVRNKNAADGHNGHFILADPVNLELTRSLAKIEVYAAEAAAVTTGKDATTTTSVTITGVSLANVPASGNLFTAPAASATLTYTDFNGTAEGTGSTSFLNTGTVSKKVNNKVDADIKNPDNYTLVSNAYYLAENNKGATATYEYGPDAYPVVGEKILTDAGEQEVASAATVLKIDYSLDGGKTSKSGYVKMPQIKRNTWYKVLARIQANGKAEIKVVAVSWDFNKEEISFEDIVSMTGNPNWGEGSTATTTYQFGLAADQTATCKFNLQTPKNGTWYATIEGKDIQDFAFVKDGQELKMVSGSIGTEDDMQFTIKTLTKLDLGDSRTVNIRLVAKGVDGRTYNVKIDNADYFTIKQQ